MKYLSIMLCSAFFAAWLALVCMPLFKASAWTEDCFWAFDVSRNFDEESIYYPCGWTFAVWHAGTGDNFRSSCNCDHGENTYYVTFSVRDLLTHELMIDEAEMRMVALWPCDGLDSQYWCAEAHVQDGFWQYKFTCHYIDDQEQEQTHHSDWMELMHSNPTCTPCWTSTPCN